MKRPSDADYRRLLAFRTGLRRFLHWSEEQAEAAGVTPAQHQLMLAIRGHDDPRGPTIGDVSDYLLLRHNSAVELVGRAEAAGFVVRHADSSDRRIVRLSLTRSGTAILDRLGAMTLDELARIAPRMRSLWAGLQTRA